MKKASFLHCKFFSVLTLKSRKVEKQKEEKKTEKEMLAQIKDEEEDDDENDEMLVEFKRRMMELQSKK